MPTPTPKKRPAGKTLTPKGAAKCEMKDGKHVTLCAILTESLTDIGKKGLQFAVSWDKPDEGRLALRSGNVSAFVHFCPFCGVQLK